MTVPFVHNCYQQFPCETTRKNKRTVRSTISRKCVRACEHTHNHQCFIFLSSILGGWGIKSVLLSRWIHAPTIEPTAQVLNNASYIMMQYTIRGFTAIVACCTPTLEELKELLPLRYDTEDQKLEHITSQPLESTVNKDRSYGKEGAHIEWRGNCCG